MNTTAILDRFISKFETRQEAESCDHWFRAKTHEAIDSLPPHIPHDEAMAHIRAGLSPRMQESTC